MKTSLRVVTALSLCLSLCLVALRSAGADDFAAARQRNWHHWRGPDADGVAPRAEPPVEWSRENGIEKNIQWKIPVPGEGSSTPIVWEERIFLLTAVKTERVDDSIPEPEDQPERPFGIKFPRNVYRFVVLCIDRASGKVMWERTACERVPHEGRHPNNSFASGSPTTDGERLYASFGSSGVYCYDLNGEPRWKRDLGDMETRHSFGEGASPVIHGDTLVVNWDHDGPSRIFALDARSGKTRWERPRDEKTTWNTPLIVEGAGRTQVVVSATNRVRSYDLETGDLIWECGGQVTNVIPSPVALDDLVFCMSGYRGNAVYAISLGSKGDITDGDGVVWTRDRGAPYVPSPLLYGDLLFFTQSNRGNLSCVRARSGELLIDRERLPGIRGLYASPVGAAGRIYITGRDGTTLVVRRGPRLEVLATNRLGEPVDASPAIAGKQIFLRSAKHLFSIAAE